MSESAWLFLGTGLTVLMALVGTIYTTRSSKANAEDTVLDDRTQKLIENLSADNTAIRADNAAVRVELAEVRAEVVAMRPFAARFMGVDLDDLSPMGDLHELGWNSYANHNYANRHGIHIVPYHDDIDERFALGWEAHPVENVPVGKQTSPAIVAARERRMIAFAAAVRIAAGYEPYKPDKGEQ